jgi:hypothetical protein
MKSWNELIATALVGTDKKGLNATQIMPEVNEHINGSSPSEQFLQALSLTHFYRKGALQARNLPDNSTFDIQEKLPMVDEEYEKILIDLLFAENDWVEQLMAKWIGVVFEKGHRIPPIHLTRCLQKLEHCKIVLSNQELDILGELGKLVAKRFELMNPTAFWTEEELFLNASPADIKTYLSQLRDRDRSAFVASIKQYWKTFALSDQQFWVKAMRVCPSEEELTFVRELWENEFPPKARETVNYTRIRTYLATILLSDQSGDFYIQTISAIQSYVIKQQKGFFSKVFSSEPGSKLQLPVAEDSFLNEKHMHEQYGLVLDAKLKAISEERIRAYFSHLISILPFRAWATLLETSQEQAFTYFAKDSTWQVKENGKPVSMLADAFEALSEFSDDEGFLLQYAGLPDTRISAIDLVRVPLHTLEQAIQGKKLGYNFSEIIYLFDEVKGREFSKDFAAYLLKESWKNYQDTSTYNLSGFADLIALMPLEIWKDVENFIYQANDSDEKSQWLQDIGVPLLEYLKLKQRIEKL